VRVGIEAPRHHKIRRGELAVRSDLTSVSELESQTETPARSEPETVSLALAVLSGAPPWASGSSRASDVPYR
jgi:hypothetical protein